MFPLCSYKTSWHSLNSLPIAQIICDLFEVGAVNEGPMHVFLLGFLSDSSVCNPSLVYNYFWILRNVKWWCETQHGHSVLAEMVIHSDRHPLHTTALQSNCNGCIRTFVHI